jgi:hypothetical protein
MWAITIDGDSVHNTPLAMVIVDRVVLDAEVVPKGDRIDTPAKAAGEFGPHPRRRSVSHWPSDDSHRACV